MGLVHIVFGPQGAGKSTYARRLATENRAIHFSIDSWMIELFGPDMPQPLDFRWIMDRVKRCEQRIWVTASDVAKTGGSVVLDLGFMKRENRSEFVELSHTCSLPTQLHFVDAPHDIRKKRVLKRNSERGDTFSFEVTSPMFDFMEKQFEYPTDDELAMSIVFDLAQLQ
ncbi:MAG: ATP-binding protein [Rhodothermales bacterium]|nr:ATP-binding protein [Rhodothermales bacterium]